MNGKERCLKVIEDWHILGEAGICVALEVGEAGPRVLDNYRYSFTCIVRNAKSIMRLINVCKVISKEQLSVRVLKLTTRTQLFKAS